VSLNITALDGSEQCHALAALPLGCCEHSNTRLGSLKGSECLDQLGYSQLPKNDCSIDFVNIRIDELTCKEYVVVFFRRNFPDSVRSDLGNCERFQSPDRVFIPDH
jgi:hypothetical protein